MDSELKIIVAVLFLIFLSIAIPVGYSVYDFHRKHVSGNQKVFDTLWNYRYADIHLPNGDTKTIEIESWNDYEGEQIQIQGKDGVSYLVSSFNTILRSK